ncbi:uncharacterized protein [Littorina saxatilis]|uniref:UBZ1-type domain-containing protein n=1 Tax=Littorina saxatilis TaxID=31220 RepID=A0AAN9G3Q7_9CAEN
MDSEDDICVLNQSPSTDDEVLEDCPLPIIPFSPFAPISPTSVDHGSHHALHKAYAEVKRRLNETAEKNRQLTRRVHELESSRTSGSYIGDSYDMMDDITCSAQGAAEAQIGAEEGYHNNLQRQLVRCKTQLQNMEKTYQDYVSESELKLNTLGQKLEEANGQISQLSQDKSTLQQSYEMVKRQKDTAQQTVEEMKQKCQTLEVEKDKALKEAALLHASLQKAHQEIGVLKEKQGDSMTEASPELVAELANMRKVIDSLKKMVLVQRDYLARKGLSASMQSNMSRSLRDPSSVESDTSPMASGRSSGGSHSGQSWEMVNGSAASTLDPRQQQQQQLLMMQQRSVSSTRGSPRLEHQDAMRTVPLVKNQAVIDERDGSRGVMVNGRIDAGVPGQRSKTDFIQRRKSEDAVVPQRSKTELIRSHTDPPPPPSPHLAEWMGTHFQQQQSTAQVGLNQFGHNPTGVSQLQQGGGTVVPSQSRIHYPPAPYSPRRQSSPARESSGSYDNVNFANRNTAGPSMHILDQSGLSGARVLRNNSDSFGSSGGSVMTLPNPRHGGGVTIPIVRDGGGTTGRGSPQEHADITQQAADPTKLELNQYHRIHFENEPAMHTGNGLDRKCPVCGQDFSHFSMDDFQTHVFECFDDAEEANGPETLQAQQQITQGVCQRSGVLNKVCPMCEKEFPENVSQQFYEGHVQSHFEEVTDHFELLEAQRS